MQIRQMRYFIVVAECGSFSQAAEVLEVAQPALSRQIKDLEDGLCVDLFRRLPRGLELTGPGKAFLKDSKSILEMIEVSRLKAANAAALENENSLIRGLVSDPCLVNSYWIEPTFSSFKILLHSRVQAELENLTRFNMIDFFISLSDAKTFTGLETVNIRTEPGLLLRQISATDRPVKKIITLKDDLCRLSLSEVGGFSNPGPTQIERIGSNLFDVISEARVRDTTAALVPLCVLKNIPDLSELWTVSESSYMFNHFLTFSTLNDNPNFAALLRTLTKAVPHANAL